jgi:hypothetical protein
MSPSGSQESESVGSDEEYWIFGYGSLIWKYHLFPPSLTADLLPITTAGFPDSSLLSSGGSGNRPVIIAEPLKHQVVS